MRRDLNRRQFIATSGGALSFAALGACSSRAVPASVSEPEPAPEEPDETVSQQEPQEQPDTSPAPSLEEDSSGFVLLTDAVPDAFQEIRYFTTFNFMGERVDGYEQPVALITRAAGEALRIASDIVVSQGYRLKVYDAYRPQAAVDHFVRWSYDTSDVRMKEYFYPELDKSVLFDLGYIATRSGHTRGSTVDLTLFDMHTGRELDMGGPYDYFGELSHASNTSIAQSQYANRMILRGAMTEAGFRPIDHEWWHFTLIDEPYPDTYFTFPSTEDAL